MATGNSGRFRELSVPGALATEIARQVTASAGDKRKLMELGINAVAAPLMVAAVAAHTVSVAALTQAGIVPAVAAEFAAQIAS